MIEIKTAEGIPTSEWSERFLQGMVDRMSMSYLKYGLVAEGYPKRVHAIQSLLLRLIAYMGKAQFEATVRAALDASDIRHRRTEGNTEYLMDAANFAMIEFMHPGLPGAFFEPTDSDGSTGRVRTSGSVDADRNTEAQALRTRLYNREGD